MRTKIRRLILLSLHACAGMPMPETALISAVDIGLPGGATRSDVMDGVRDLDAEGYLVSVPDDGISGRQWGLSAAGEMKVRQIR